MFVHVDRWISGKTDKSRLMPKWAIISYIMADNVTFDEIMMMIMMTIL
jgi:hypothetical protein